MPETNNSNWTLEGQEPQLARGKLNQLAIYKHGRGSELGLPRINPASGQSGTYELRASDLQVQRSNHSATQPLLTVFLTFSVDYPGLLALLLL